MRGLITHLRVMHRKQAFLLSKGLVSTSSLQSQFPFLTQIQTVRFLVIGVTLVIGDIPSLSALHDEGWGGEGRGGCFGFTNPAILAWSADNEENNRAVGH